MNGGYGYTLNKYDISANSRRNNLGLNVGVTVGFNLFDGNRRRELRNARIAVQNARLEREQLEQALRADLSNLWQAYQNNLQMLNLERQNLVAAKENHEIAMERYMLGNLSGIEMREAQRACWMPKNVSYRRNMTPNYAKYPCCKSVEEWNNI